MLALFKSHYSIGKSILTLDDPKKTSENGSDSIFKIAKDHSLSSVILVEDTLIGFFEAFKRSKELNIQLIFGLRLSMRNSSLPDDENSHHKVIVFSKNPNGCKLLNKIYSKAFCDFEGFLDFKSLKELWNNEDLKLVIPFYDSFLFMNHFSFNNCLPDFQFCVPTFLTEDNGLPFDHLLVNKVHDFANTLNAPINKAKSIYYKDKKDSTAFQTYKIICNRMAGKERTLSRPELNHFCSDEFCFESWKEKSNVTI